MSHRNILWLYIILLVIGGLIGFFKGKSKVSLIMSVCFAAALALCASGIVFQPYVADILLIALLVVAISYVVLMRHRKERASDWLALGYTAAILLSIALLTIDEALHEVWAELNLTVW